MKHKEFINKANRVLRSTLDACYRVDEETESHPFLQGYTKGNNDTIKLIKKLFSMDETVTRAIQNYKEETKLEPIPLNPYNEPETTHAEMLKRKDKQYWENN